MSSVIPNLASTTTSPAKIRFELQFSELAVAKRCLILLHLVLPQGRNYRGTLIWGSKRKLVKWQESNFNSSSSVKQDSVPPEAFESVLDQT